jgi:hypothetical protein
MWFFSIRRFGLATAAPSIRYRTCCSTVKALIDPACVSLTQTVASGRTEI